METAVSRAHAKITTPSQLHLDLQGRTLKQFIDKLSAVAYRANPDSPRNIEAYRAVRAAVEAELRQVIVAFDTCGLANLCQEAEAFDPWEDKG